MNLGQNVCLDHLWVRFSKCCDAHASVTGQSWLFCLVFFPEKTRLVISCKSSARQVINMKCQALFYLKNTPAQWLSGRASAL